MTHPDGQTRFAGEFKNHLTTGNIGNAFLKDRGLLVWVTGRRNQAVVREWKKKVRAFQPTGLKLVFAILCEPRLIGTDYRTLARTAGIALGNVGWILRDLVDGGFVRKIGRDRRLLVEPRKLLDRWTTAYVEVLRPRLLLGHYLGTRTNGRDWKEINVRKYDTLWGGEPAGALLTKMLEPETLTIYVDKIPPRLVVDERLVKDERGPLELRQKFWTVEPLRPDVVPYVLAYADLIAIGDARTIETANRILEHYIVGYFNVYAAGTTR